MTKHFDDMVETADTIGEMVNDRFSDGRERFTVLAMALCACAKWQGYSKEESAGRRGQKRGHPETRYGGLKSLNNLVTPHKRRHRHGLLLGRQSQWSENFSPG